MSGTHIGKTIFIAQALPATNDEAGFAALNYTKVEGLQILPQFGVSHNNIDRSDLQSGFVQGLKGSGSGTDSTMTFHTIDGDAGQAILKTAAAAFGEGGDVSLKVVRGSGPNEAAVAGDPVVYAQGYVHSDTENQGDDSNYEGFTVNFKQNAIHINGTEV